MFAFCFKHQDYFSGSRVILTSNPRERPKMKEFGNVQLTLVHLKDAGDVTATSQEMSLVDEAWDASMHHFGHVKKTNMFPVPDLFQFPKFINAR